MELRDGDLVLRPWAEDDVDALVVGCNDPEIARWIPTIPHPYTREDALAFIRGEVRPEHQAFAIELGRARRRRHRNGFELACVSRDDGLLGRRPCAGPRHLHACASIARLGMRSTNSGFSASIS